MKKLFLVAISFLLTLCCLFPFGGCKTVSDLTKWYKKSTLADLSLEGLPKPDFEYVYHDNLYRRVCGIIEEEAFTVYAQEVFTYLREKFEYLGTSGEELSRSDMFGRREYAYEECEKELENYVKEIKASDGALTAIEYKFLYFESNLSGENKKWTTDDHVFLTYYLSPVTQEDRNGEKYTVNFEIELRKQGVAIEYLAYERMLEDIYEKEYPDCGEAELLHFYGRDYDNRYWIAMFDASQISYDQALWTEKVGGYYFNYPNGNQISVVNSSAVDSSAFCSLTEAYEKCWLDSEDLKRLENKHAEFYPALYELPTEKASLVEFEAWLAELTAEEIAFVKTTKEFCGVAPGMLKNIQRTEDKTVIGNLLQEYQSLQMSHMSRDDYQIDGGSSFTVEFTLTSGTVKKLHFNNGNYNGNEARPELSSLQYFKLDKVPKLENAANVQNAYAFISYDDSFTVTTSEALKVYQYCIDRLEFVEYTGETDFDESEVRVDFDGGSLYVCSSDVFYVEEENEREYYQIVGDINFDALPLW